MMSELFSLLISYENLETQKKDKSEDLSYLVDHDTDLSNFYASYARLVRFAEYLENRGIQITSL